MIAKHNHFSSIHRSPELDCMGYHSEIHIHMEYNSNSVPMEYNWSLVSSCHSAMVVNPVVFLQETNKGCIRTPCSPEPEHTLSTMDTLNATSNHSDSTLMPTVSSLPTVASAPNIVDAAVFCCCTSTAPTKMAIVAEMNMPSLIRWFTVTGIIFGLVIIFWIINIIIFHRHHIVRVCKKHFTGSQQSQRTRRDPNELLGDIEAGNRSGAEEQRTFTHLLGQMGYWMRKSWWLFLWISFHHCTNCSPYA